MNVSNPESNEYLKPLCASHNASFITYHIVWGTHHRRRLTDANSDNAMEIISNICDEKGYTILNLAIAGDHVHLLLKAKPTDTVAEMVKYIKGKSSYELGKMVDGDSDNGIWAKGYYAETVGNRTVAQIKSYIDKQKEHHSSYGSEGEEDGLKPIVIR